MTAEDLIVAIADEAPRLKEAALRLLIELIAMALEQGHCTMSASHRTLADRTGMSREGVAIGVREVAKLITVTDLPRQLTMFTLPAHWLPPQRRLFEDTEAEHGEKSTSGNPAGPGQRCRPDLANNPGQAWPTFQASWPTIQASLANVPGQGRRFAYKERARAHRSINQ